MTVTDESDCQRKPSQGDKASQLGWTFEKALHASLRTIYGRGSGLFAFGAVMRVDWKVTGAVAGLLLVSFGTWAATKYDLVGSLFSTDYMAHRFCYLLQPGLVWTNAVSDCLIWLSYIAIAVGLAALLHKTRALLAFRWVFVAFGLFIVACGFTHFFEVVTLWEPVYWLSTSVKVLTAAASLATAAVFVPVVPRVQVQ
jgi:hypothetical protein